MPLDAVPDGANVIASHTIYKVKECDDSSLPLTAHIAPHGNEDDLRREQRSDCAMRSPVGMRVQFSTARLFKWKKHKVDVKYAFLQNGSARQDIFLVPPRQSPDRGKVLWMLSTAAYGLVKSNSKWQ